MNSRDASTFSRILLLGVALFWSMPARSEIQLRGFASAAGVLADSPYDLVAVGNRGGRPTFDTLTRMGINLFANIGGEVDFFTQVHAAGGPTDFGVKADWLFVTYRPTDAFTVRAGRQIFQAWLLSEQIDVGFTYPWVRPADEVYSLNPMKSFSGVLLGYRFGSSESYLLAEVQGGSATVNVDDENTPYTGTVDNIRNLSLSYNREGLLLRAGYGAGKLQITSEAVVPSSAVPVEIDLPPALGGGSLGVPLPDELYFIARNNLDVGTAQFFSLGAKIDHERFILLSEAASRLVEGTAIRRADAVYGTFGYKLGRIMPHLTYAWMGNLQGTAWIHPGYLSEGITTRQKDQHSWIVGLNTVLSPSAILKTQYQDTKLAYEDANRDFRSKAASMALELVF